MMVSTLKCIPLVPFRWGHSAVHIGDPVELDGGGCSSNGLRYRCRVCGKIKDYWY